MHAIRRALAISIRLYMLKNGIDTQMLPLYILNLHFLWSANSNMMQHYSQDCLQYAQEAFYPVSGVINGIISYMLFGM